MQIRDLRNLRSVNEYVNSTGIPIRWMAITVLIASFERVFPTPANSKTRPHVKKMRFFFSSTKEHGIRKPWRLQGAQRNALAEARRTIAGSAPCRDWPRAYKPHHKIAFASWQGKTNRLDVNGTRKSWSDRVAPYFRPEIHVSAKEVPSLVLARPFSYLNPRSGNELDNLSISETWRSRAKLLYLKYWRMRFVPSGFINKLASADYDVGSSMLSSLATISSRKKSCRQGSTFANTSARVITIRQRRFANRILWQRASRPSLVPPARRRSRSIAS